ncbi:F-box/SPRY domain-containing protein 1 [Sciurus carolinensis]|uniref:F-box/SPRY domain-containing protein 1 n=1 Tax=Sciurus carolinensis TaxID=30640 RepID=A0AA41SW20_SCICA|nr:F-box/SPRY domain-containing protein 1 [Sciurus carolinensis]
MAALGLGAGAALVGAGCSGGGAGDASGSAGIRAWLPSRVLDLVFSYLELLELQSCTLVCKHWYRCLQGDENNEVSRSLCARSLAEEALRTHILCNLPATRPRYVLSSMPSALMTTPGMSILRRMALLCIKTLSLRALMVQGPRLVSVRVTMRGKCGGRAFWALWQ